MNFLCPTDILDAAGSNGKVSEWLTEVESATNGASATFSSADLNKSGNSTRRNELH